MAKQMDPLNESCEICEGEAHCDKLIHVTGVVMTRLVELDMIALTQPEYADIAQYRLICDRCGNYVRIMDKVIGG